MSHRRCRLSGDTPVYLGFDRNICKTVGHFISWISLNGDLIYWSKRMGTHPEMHKRTASLLKKQKGKCLHCGLTFQENDVIETDHIIPTAAGGRDEYKNLQLLHRHCHDEKSRTDLTVIQKHQSLKRIEET